DGRPAGAGGIVPKLARPARPGALFGPDGLARRKRKETPRERARPIWQCPGAARRGSIGVALSPIPKGQRLGEMVSSAYRERPRLAQQDDRCPCAQAPDRPLALRPRWRDA